ncbi:TLC domain-containing protein At5g14285-like [Lotus japonicus]|uniref:TLC domain-containing protein At5g14285-like n=1 Tax=Lotus japonicus TaxID=34305 RepID=UPI0025859085|nr:TLC domain-containing protein At5g14285-like [Lotus japonicus]
MQTLAFEQGWVVFPFFSMFLTIYLFGYFIIFRNRSPEIRSESCSCLISLFHGTPAVILGVTAITNSGFAAANTALQNTVLDFSTAYFVTDLLHYVAFSATADALFVAHHLATLFVVVTCRHAVSHGAFAVLMLLVLAEVTSLCQNIWTLAGARRREDPFAAKVYDAISPPFYAVYSVVRGLVGPYFVYRMVAFYAGGGARGLVPAWVWVSWVVVVVMAIGGSIMWIYSLWLQLYRERSGVKLEKKVR